MKHSQVIKHYGTPTRASNCLWVSLQTLRNWKKSGIPKKAQNWIEFRTDAKLKADRNGK